MGAVTFSAIITIIVGYLIFKKYKAQTVLMLGGLILMVCAVIFMKGVEILPKNQSTGWVGFDFIKFISDLFASRAAGIGLMIMSVGGFARYMDKIGASRVLVKVVIKPLAYLKAPYVVLGAGYIIGQILNVFIPSASGLGLLLMVTMYPILVKLGVSRAAATAMIGTAACLDLGPASGSSVLAAKNAGLDVADYFISYQIPVALCVMPVIAIAHIFLQKWFDKKDGFVAGQEDLVEEVAKEEERLPTIYILLPLLPLIFILGFSNVFFPKVLSLFGFEPFEIKLDLVPVMLICLFISMLFEFIRSRNAKQVFQSIQVFFDGMGSQFAMVVTLIVAGEVFAKGLTSIGTISTIIDAAHYSGFGLTGMTVVMTSVISLSAIVMGSGNAPFFAFAALAPDIATQLSVSPVLMLLPMQLAAGIARSVSPITAVIVAVSGVSNVLPTEVVKRTAIPMALALIITLVATFVFVH